MTPGTPTAAADVLFGFRYTIGLVGRRVASRIMLTAPRRRMVEPETSLVVGCVLVAGVRLLIILPGFRTVRIRRPPTLQLNPCSNC